MKNTTKVRRGILGAVMGLVLLASAVPAAGADSGVTRISGQDRYQTAAAVSRAGFAPGVQVAYVASGEGFADALSGAPAAGARRAPVLLVRSGQVPTHVAQELTRLRPATIVVLGGPAAVSDTVLTELETYTAGEVRRLSGADRYATSADVSRSSFQPGVRTAYLASGADFADALAGAPLAAANGAPVLLVQPGGITDEVAGELERLDPDSITIFGGSNAVHPSVQKEVATYTDGEVTRVAGGDRYETATAIARLFGPGITSAYVASGQAFPDALAAAPVAGARRSPVFLARQNQATLPDLPSLERVILVGGTSVLSDRVRGQGEAHLAKLDEPTPAPGDEDPVRATASPSGRMNMAGYAIPYYILADMTDTSLRQAMAGVRDGGAGWVRIDLPPTEMQFPDGPHSAPDWAPVDRIINAADAAGLQILVAPATLPRQLQTHGWRTGPTTDTQRAAYTEFVRGAAARYGAVVDAWELWNEPNSTDFWAPVPDADDYVALIRQAYPAIKANDPDSPVVAGGTAWVGDHPDIPTAAWYRQVYAAGGQPYFDASAVHPYPDIGWSRVGHHFRGGEMGPVTDVRATMDAHGDRDKPIWGTETGYPTGGSGSVSEQEQAAWLPVIYDGWTSQTTSRGATGPLFWYTLRDYGGAHREEHFGAVRADGTPKPAYHALRDWTER